MARFSDQLIDQLKQDVSLVQLVDGEIGSDSLLSHKRN